MLETFTRVEHPERCFIHAHLMVSQYAEVMPAIRGGLSILLASMNLLHGFTGSQHQFREQESDCGLCRASVSWQFLRGAEYGILSAANAMCTCTHSCLCGDNYGFSRHSLCLPLFRLRVVVFLPSPSRNNRQHRAAMSDISVSALNASTAEPVSLGAVPTSSPSLLGGLDAGDIFGQYQTLKRRFDELEEVSSHLRRGRQSLTSAGSIR